MHSERNGLSHIVHCTKYISEARSIIETFKIDFVISDWDLPDGIGPVLFSRIRELNENAVICLCSANSQAKGQGEDKFFSKGNTNIDQFSNSITEAASS
jgi:DNA-binding response OmpR family regulator